MAAPGIADRRRDGEMTFSTAEIKSRIEAMFDVRTSRKHTDRYDSSDRHEAEPQGQDVCAASARHISSVHG